MEEKDLKDLLIETQYELIKQYQDKVYLLEKLLEKQTEEHECKEDKKRLPYPPEIELYPKQPIFFELPETNKQYIVPQDINYNDNNSASNLPSINPITHMSLQTVPVRFVLPKEITYNN